jgi:dTDP-4-amino-4,6-dideoxygalactose transaminase
MQSALGISQLRKLNRFINRRREVAEYYDKVFGTDERFIIPKVAENVKHAYHLYPLRINFDIVKKSKEEIFLELREKNIYCQVHYIPLHLQPYFRDRFGFIEGDFPIAEKFYKEEISIPIYPSLDDSDLTYISEQILEIIK